MPRIAWFFTLLIIVACENNKQPPGILSENEMVKVMSELYITEEKVKHLAIRPDSAQKAFDIIEGQIFKKSGVDDSVFKKSYRFYAQDPVKLQHLYTALIDSLSLREQRMNTQRSEE
jgi:Domain of unknown function (DUF4296)